MPFRSLRQERQVVFTLRSAAPLDKGLCARLLACLLYTSIGQAVIAAKAVAVHNSLHQSADIEEADLIPVSYTHLSMVAAILRGLVTTIS